VICWDGQAKSATVVDQQGKPVPTLMAYWFAWHAFHPSTEVYTGNSKIAKPGMKLLDGACEKI